MQQLIWAFLIFFAMVLVVWPTIGAALVWQGLKIGRVSEVTFGRCWRIYFAASCYTTVALMIWGFFTQRQADSLFVKAVNTLLVFGIPLLVVPIFIRNYSPSAITVQTIAVLLAQGLILFVLLAGGKSTSKGETPADRNPLPRRGSVSGTVLPDASETKSPPAEPDRPRQLARD
jgi:hypothetical protein